MVRGLVVVVVVEGIIVFVVVIVVVLWLFGGLGGIVLRLLLPLFDCCGDVEMQAICLL